MKKNRAGPQKPPYVGALLRLSVATVRERLQVAVARHGYADITTSQLAAFSYPFPDGLKPIELAARANQSKQAINHMLAELEDGGYLTRKAVRAGGRRRIYLTAKGRKVVSICQREMIALQDEWSARVGRRQFNTFLDVLRQMPAGDGDDRN